MKMVPTTSTDSWRMPVKYSVQRQPRDGLITKAVDTIGPELDIKW